MFTLDHVTLLFPDPFLSNESTFSDVRAVDSFIIPSCSRVGTRRGGAEKLDLVFRDLA